MALDGLFDLPARQFTAVHAGSVGSVLSKLKPLDLGA